jgi:hypothetical protein
LFDKIHVTGASASCPGDISSDESSAEDVSEVKKMQGVMMLSWQQNQEKGNVRTALLLLKKRRRRTPSFDYITTHV